MEVGEWGIYLGGIRIDDAHICICFWTTKDNFFHVVSYDSVGWHPHLCIDELKKFVDVS
jgi:hypothetical protein